MKAIDRLSLLCVSAFKLFLSYQLCYPRRESPEINVCTDPRFGCIKENFGEDPAHVTAFTVAAVTGLQGGTAQPSEYLPDNNAVVCEAKHCCAYGAGGRDGQSANISPKTLHDIYLRPWDAFVVAGGRG